MAKEKVTDYETVEKTVEKYRCDHCKTVCDPEDTSAVYISDSALDRKIPRSKQVKEQKHLCENCIGLQTALEVERKNVSKRELFNEFWTPTKDRILWAVYILPAVAFGIATGITSTWLHSVAEDPSWFLDVPMAGLMVFTLSVIVGIAVTEAFGWMK